MWLSGFSSWEQIRLYTSEETLGWGEGCWDQEKGEQEAVRKQRSLCILISEKKSHKKIIDLPFPSTGCEATFPCELKGTHWEIIYKFNKTWLLSKAPRFLKGFIQSSKHWTNRNFSKSLLKHTAKWNLFSTLKSKRCESDWEFTFVTLKYCLYELITCLNLIRKFTLKQ